MAVVEIGIFCLQMAGVRKHDRAEIDGGRCRVNGPTEASLHQPWNPAAMVEVSVSKNDSVDRVRGNRYILPVAFAPFLLALKHAAVNKNLKTACAAGIVGGVDQVF